MPDEPADEQGERDVEHARQVGEAVADPRREHGAEEQLALGADVEQAGLHADDDGEAGERERGGPGQRAGDVLLAAERAVDAAPCRRSTGWSR